MNSRRRRQRQRRQRRQCDGCKRWVPGRSAALLALYTGLCPDCWNTHWDNIEAHPW